MSPQVELAAPEAQVITYNEELRNQTTEIPLDGMAPDDPLSLDLAYAGVQGTPVAEMYMGDERFAIVDVSGLPQDEQGNRHPFPAGLLHNRDRAPTVPDAGPELPTLVLMHFENGSAVARPIVPGKPMFIGRSAEVREYDIREKNEPFSYSRMDTISRNHGGLILDPDTGQLRYTDHDSKNGTSLRSAYRPAQQEAEAGYDSGQQEETPIPVVEYAETQSGQIAAYAATMEGAVRAIQSKQELSTRDTAFLSVVASGMSRDIAAVLRERQGQLPQGAFDTTTSNSLWSMVGAARKVIAKDEEVRGGETWLMEEFDRRFQSEGRVPHERDVEWLMAHMADSSSMMDQHPELRRSMEHYAEEASWLMSGMAHRNPGMRITRYMEGNMQWVAQQYDLVQAQARQDRELQGDPRFTAANPGEASEYSVAA